MQKMVKYELLTLNPEYQAYMAYENYKYNPKSEGQSAKLKSLY